MEDPGLSDLSISDESAVEDCFDAEDSGAGVAIGGRKVSCRITVGLATTGSYLHVHEDIISALFVLM